MLSIFPIAIVSDQLDLKLSEKLVMTPELKSTKAVGVTPKYSTLSSLPL
jgi:hypothetical protein